MSRGSENRRFILASLGDGWFSCRKRLLNEIDQLIPNSESEALVLRQELSKKVPITVVPNVIDAQECVATEKMPWEKRKMILCVGHFCPRKNQLMLINALKSTDISVVFAGGPRQMHKRYYERCRKVAGNQHTFLGHCSNKKILQLMGQSKVHIQTSFVETPGLVNLEAGLMGCNLVSPPLQPVKDYFGELGSYFSTYKIDSIQKTILSALKRNPQHLISGHILKNYTMTQLKKRLLIAYQKG